MLNKNAVVYVLVASDKEEEIRYVGRTINPKDRLQSHIVHAKNNKKTYVHRWINKTIKKGDSIVMKIIESNLTYEEAGVREIYWIDYYKKQGLKLTNLTRGGDGSLGLSHSKETRKKLSKVNLGRTRSLETREKIRKAGLGRPVSAETREKLRKARLGKTASAETREKLRKANLGRPLSLEHLENLRKAHQTAEIREKLRKAATGKTPSAETREKMRKAHLGKTPSAETREKIRKANLGRPRLFSLEHLENLRKAHQTAEIREKLRKAATGKTPSAETREKMRKAAIRGWAKRKQVKSINRPINRPI